MDLLGLVVSELTVLSAVIEAICETVFRILVNLGIKDLAAAWKPVLVMILSVVGCMGLSIDMLVQVGVVFAYPWVGALFTGFLVGGGADILHLVKNGANPTVKA